MTQIKNSTLLLTGADGGIGKALVDECLQQGAKKIYATGLSLEKLNSIFSNYENVVTIELDVTNADRIKKCAKECADANIIINNAGVEFKVPFIAEKSSQAALFEMKVNYIALIDMINCFVPHLEKLENAAIVNILSMGALVVVKRLGTYCASKTASHILTETIREELEAKNIKVLAAYMGYVNTAMVPEETETQKSSPNAIAKGICDGINNNENHIIPDNTTKNYVKENPIETVFFG